MKDIEIVEKWFKTFYSIGADESGIHETERQSLRQDPRQHQGRSSQLFRFQE